LKFDIKNLFKKAKAEMKVLSVIVILLIVVAVASIEVQNNPKYSGGQSKMIYGPEKKATSGFVMLKEAWEKLTAIKYKDHRDICVWKICSRPLKKTTKAAAKKLEMKDVVIRIPVVQFSRDPNGNISFRVLKS